MTITQWHVPVDDEKHYWYAIFTSFGAPVEQGRDAPPAARALSIAGLHPEQEQEQRLRLRSARAGARDLYRHGRRHQRARPVGLRVDGRDPGPHRRSISAPRTRRSPPTAGCCGRRSSRSGKGEKPIMVLDAARPPRITGPAAIDGIGPADDWQGYWQRVRSATSARPRAGSPGASLNGTAQAAASSTAAEFRRAPRPVDAPSRRARRATVERAIKKHKLEVVRFSFADQHGVLRGKTLLAADAVGAHARRRHHDDDAARQGHRAQKRVSGVHRRRRLRHGGDAGRRRFRHGRRSGDVPRAAVGRTTPAGCCATSYFTNGKPVPFSTRARARDALATLGKARLRLSRRARGRIPSVQAGEPAARAGRRHLAAAGAGGQPAHAGLSVSHRDALRHARPGGRDPARAASSRSACRCARSRSSSGRARSNSPSARRSGLPPPTRMVLFRAAVKQIARRNGYARELHVPAGAAAT